MNKDEIKKALEFCADASPCEGCAYHDDLMCTDKLKTDALNVIIEQEQEIEKWKNDYAKLQEQFAQYQMASDKEIIAQRKQAKIEVLNKLKERVETAIDAYFNLDSGGYYLAEGALDDIDELIEEVEE
jgi:hypothetical protein